MAEAELDGVRVLVIATEQVGELMAGPAIRSLNVARQLAQRGAQVTIALPREPGEAVRGGLLEGIEVATYGFPSARSIGPLARAVDVVVTQPLRVDVQWSLARSGARVVVDLYVPSFVERIAQLGVEEHGGGDDQRGGDRNLKRRLLERDRREYAAAIQFGDAFVCASERQKDFWLGALGQAGRFDLELLGRDPRAELLVGVAPFGVPDEPPGSIAPDDGVAPVLRGPVVSEDAVIALWTGGLWNWFDPVLVVEALALARQVEPRLHLVVMGVRHPEAAWSEQDAARRMRERAQELGLIESGAVVLLEGWVPYEQRHRYLLEADVAVSAHHDTLETRYSFRTRFLDQLWCALPSITTEGGELTEAMVEAGAAVAVEDGDVDAMTAALVNVAVDADLRGQLSAGARSLAPELRWSVTMQPLARIVAAQAREREQGAALRRARRSMRELVSYLRLLVGVRIQAKGARSLAGAARGFVGK